MLIKSLKVVNRSVTINIIKCRKETLRLWVVLVEVNWVVFVDFGVEFIFFGLSGLDDVGELFSDGDVLILGSSMQILNTLVKCGKFT